MSSKETKRNIKIAFLFLVLSLSLCLFLILINSIIFHPPLMNCHAFSLVRALKRTKPQMKLICCLHLFRSSLLLLSGCVFLLIFAHVGDERREEDCSFGGRHLRFFRLLEQCPVDGGGDVKVGFCRFEGECDTLCDTVFLHSLTLLSLHSSLRPGDTCQTL